MKCGRTFTATLISGEAVDWAKTESMTDLSSTFCFINLLHKVACPQRPPRGDSPTTSTLSRVFQGRVPYVGAASLLLIPVPMGTRTDRKDVYEM
ncbi:unnamed protein product [Gadus morhua 'NCC']